MHPLLVAIFFCHAPQCNMINQHKRNPTTSTQGKYFFVLLTCHMSDMMMEDKFAHRQARTQTVMPFANVFDKGSHRESSRWEMICFLLYMMFQFQDGRAFNQFFFVFFLLVLTDFFVYAQHEV
jgi:hypothetical protein